MIIKLFKEVVNNINKEGKGALLDREAINKINTSKKDKEILLSMLIHSRNDLIREYGYERIDEFGKRFIKFFGL